MKMLQVYDKQMMYYQLNENGYRFHIKMLQVYDKQMMYYQLNENGYRFHTNKL